VLSERRIWERKDKIWMWSWLIWVKLVVLWHAWKLEDMHRKWRGNRERQRREKGRERMTVRTSDGAQRACICWSGKAISLVPIIDTVLSTFFCTWETWLIFLAHDRWDATSHGSNLTR
jgi:hypothetical protein